MLASDMEHAKLEAHRGEQLVYIVAFQDFEVNGDEVELEVHEGGDDDVASPTKGMGPNVWVCVDERAGVYAPLQEKPRVATKYVSAYKYIISLYYISFYLLWN
jgi:hypothetical protein